MICKSVMLLIFLISFKYPGLGEDKKVSSGSPIRLQGDKEKQKQCYYQGYGYHLALNNSGIFDQEYHCCYGFCDSFGWDTTLVWIRGGGIWVGALLDTSTSNTPHIIKSVTTADDGGSSPTHEMFGNPDGSDKFFVTGTDNPNDVSVAYYDIFDEISNIGWSLPNPYHTPLGIKVWQRSLAWKESSNSVIFPLEFYVTNAGEKTLDSVFLGFLTIPANMNANGIYNELGFLPDVRTAYFVNAGAGRNKSIGLTMLDFTQPSDSSGILFNSLAPLYSYHDSVKYKIMSNNISYDPRDPAFLVSAGPYLSFRPGDTLRFFVALVLGDGISEGYNNLRSNAGRALALYRRGYSARPVISSPPLQITRDNNKVILDWQWKPGDAGSDPVETWDDEDQFLDKLPFAHWRKTNPPAGHTKGGRIFEAFRIWRSESPTFKPNTFALLKQFDVADDLNLEIQTGLQYTLVDSNLNPERQYWYAVTSVSIPEFASSVIPVSGGGFDTMIVTLSPPLESKIIENAVFISPSESYHLHQSYPNPFNPKTTIAYYIPEATNVSLVIYDVLGRKVIGLVSEPKQAGRHETEWDASGFASGLYICRMHANGYTQSIKLLLIR